MSKSNEDGFSLIDAMIGGFLVAVTCASSSSFLAVGAKVLREDRLSTNRDKLLNSLRSMSGNPSALRASLSDPASGNQALKQCVTASTALIDDVGRLPLPKCDGQGFHPFYLHNPISQDDTDFSGAWAGPEDATVADTVAWDANAEVCDTSSGGARLPTRCLFRTVAKFRAICPPLVSLGPPAPGCDVAESIEVVFTIEPLNPASQLKSLEGFAFVPVLRISGQQADVHPIIITLPPINTAGTSPDPTATPSDPDQPPPVLSITCPGGTIYNGSGCSCPKGTVLVDRRGTCLRQQG